MENYTEIKIPILKDLNVGSVQVCFFLEKESQYFWRYYSLTRLKSESRLSSIANRGSLVNRADGFFRYFAGLSINSYPPLSR